eukprot:g18993.t1
MDPSGKHLRFNKSAWKAESDEAVKIPRVLRLADDSLARPQIARLLEARTLELATELLEGESEAGDEAETAWWSALRLAESLAVCQNAEVEATLRSLAIRTVRVAEKPELLVAALEVLAALPQHSEAEAEQKVFSLEPAVVEKLLLLLVDMEEEVDLQEIAWVMLEAADQTDLEEHLEVLNAAASRMTEEVQRKPMTAAEPFEPEEAPEKSPPVGRFNWPEVRPPQPPEVPNRDPATCILSKLLRDDAVEPKEPIAVKERLWQWARPQVEGEGPCARGGHTATFGAPGLRVDRRNELCGWSQRVDRSCLLVGPTDPQKPSARIVIFGGHYDGGSGAGFVYLNDTHILDIDENTWTVPRCRGTAPEPRYGHAAALVGGRVVYFGGKGKTSCFRDLHALDTSTYTWFQGPSSGGAPSARHGHTANLHGTRLYVFGGTCSGKYFGDLHCLDLASMAWSCPPATGLGNRGRERAQANTAVWTYSLADWRAGFPVDVRWRGEDNSGDLLKNSYCNDVRVLDLGRMLWSMLRTHGTPPVGRFSHSLSLSEDDAIVFGGWSGATNQAFAWLEDGGKF